MKCLFITNPDRTEILIDNLTELWLASVGASHHFLQEKDIQQLIPFVRMGLANIDTLIVAELDNAFVAFMGIDCNKIEMLFVEPSYFGKGIGRQLVELAIANHDVLFVDAKEQNPQAVGFYKHLGFEVFERSEKDDQGNAFPILKMKR